MPPRDLVSFHASAIWLINNRLIGSYSREHVCCRPGDTAEPAPGFYAKALSGEQFTNNSVKGKVVLFEFWTTWCPYCRGEESLVNDVTDEFAAKGLIALAVDVGESKKVVQKYLKEHPRKCRMLLTEDTNLAASHAATSYPI